ncbi:MAG: Mor transcription activator family protein [Gallionellaceae bacterium]|nr:Mor transcription activator family protein [Gallionellaceae bacterium]
MSPDQISVDLLPAILREMVELIGLPAVMVLVEKRGGIGLYVPKGELAEDHGLVKWIGREAAEKLQSEYPGEELEIPLALRAMTAVRNAEIKSNPQGLSVSQLARIHRTTERNIRYIRNEVGDDRQQGLF